jgi:hypothetical protein
MKKHLGKSLAAMALLLLTSMPAAAQLGIRVEIPLPGLEIRVGHRAPPPMRREVRTRRPDRQHLWVRGSWDWQQNDWAWIPGRWERPEYRNARWIKARYVREGRAWRYEPAHWSNQRLSMSDDYRQWRSNKGRDRDRNRRDRHDRRDGRDGDR